MKHLWIFKHRPSDGALDWQISRADLEGPELVLYDSTLPRLLNPGPEQLRMLAAYAWAVCELKRAAQGDDQALTLWLRDCMIYARNGLGIADRRVIDFMDLLLRWQDDWPPVYLSMDSAWERTS